MRLISLNIWYIHKTYPIFIYNLRLDIHNIEISKTLQFLEFKENRKKVEICKLYIFMPYLRNS